MRWDNLTLSDESAQEALFGVGDVMTRTFDTPEFRGMTFYEIRARSIINKVPGASRMPFSWTLNPYRGCSHACRYCQSGDTPILMADGRTKRLAEVRVGDARPRESPMFRSTSRWDSSMRRCGGRSSRARLHHAPGSVCAASSLMQASGAGC